eukprot:GILI01011923.1.p1 GENE.GILI01011923.1~~GILI01011923.1.p1  ORF type:complete len:211 (-),score=34.66 GILI01011923.1:136-768(-)
MTAKLSRASEVVALKSAMATMKDPASSGSASALVPPTAEQANALKAHFRPPVQQLLEELSATKRDQILAYYLKELRRTSDDEDNVGTASESFIVPSASPNETITSAITARIQHFHGFEQVVRERMHSEGKSQRSVKLYSLVLIAVFLAVLTGGVYFLVMNPDNPLVVFYTEIFSGASTATRMAKRDRRLQEKQTAKKSKAGIAEVADQEL